MTREERQLVAETVNYLSGTYLQLELPDRIRRHASLVRPLDPWYATQLEARADEIESRRP